MRARPPALLVGLASVLGAAAATTLITQANFRIATHAWCENAATAKATYGDIEGWDTSNVNDMTDAFCAVTRVTDCNAQCHTFNADLNSWNTANVEGFFRMFANSSFNGDISTWQTSSAKTMENMFYTATKFNTKLSDWDTSGVAEFISMFRDAVIFNQDVGRWNTSNAHANGLTGTFEDASSFNQNLNAWQTSEVVSLEFTFYNAHSFNQNLNAWQTSKVVLMDETFTNARSFAQTLSCWDTSAVFKDGDGNGAFSMYGIVNDQRIGGDQAAMEMCACCKWWVSSAQKNIAPSKPEWANSGSPAQCPACGATSGTTSGTTVCPAGQHAAGGKCVDDDVDNNGDGMSVGAKASMIGAVVVAAVVITASRK
jgi:hypothetical protein